MHTAFQNHSKYKQMHTKNRQQIQFNMTRVQKARTDWHFSATKWKLCHINCISAINLLLGYIIYSIQVDSAWLWHNLVRTALAWFSAVHYCPWSTVCCSAYGAASIFSLQRQAAKPESCFYKSTFSSQWWPLSTSDPARVLYRYDMGLPAKFCCCMFIANR